MRYEIVEKVGADYQVGLRFFAETPLQADEVHRLLCARVSVSKLLPSKFGPRSGLFTHFVYVSAQRTKAEQAWLEAVAEYHAQPKRGTLSRSKKTSQISFEAWKEQFRAHLRSLSQDNHGRTPEGSGLTVAGIKEAVEAGHSQDIETLVLAGEDSRALRLQIALLSEQQSFSQLVVLCDTRREQVLALPTSGLLAEQVVGAYLEMGKEQASIEVLQAAQQFAQAFLPELERLRQAEGLRTLLRNSAISSPTLDIESPTQGSLSEQLVVLLEMSPTERLPILERLAQRYPHVSGLRTTLAETYAALDDSGQALSQLETLAQEEKLQDAEDVRRQTAPLLLSERRLEELLDLTKQDNTLAGWRGIALYEMNLPEEARPWLEQAWRVGERDTEVLLRLARLSGKRNDLDLAADPYRWLLECIPERLGIEDYLTIADLADNLGFGDLPPSETVKYFDRLVALASPDLDQISHAAGYLRRRVELHSEVEDNLMQIAWQDWLELLAEHKDEDSLVAALSQLQQSMAEHHLSRHQAFEILEVLEPYISTLPSLKDWLVRDYMNLAVVEVDESLRQNRNEAPFFVELLRALYVLEPTAGELIHEQRQLKLDGASAIGLQPPEPVTVPSMIDLSNVRLGLVGGHSAVRRATLRYLQQEYRLQDPVEIPTTRESAIDRVTLREKLINCTWVAVITGYIGHDLSGMISDLFPNNTLQPKIQWLSSRGKSGVVREILAEFERTSENDSNG
jgi:tetratricopeptide (TPR) repeat protein